MGQASRRKRDRHELMAPEHGEVPARTGPAGGPRSIQQVTHQEFHQGPIPAASEMARYEELLPGAADRILRMAEAEQATRHRVFENAVQAEIEVERHLQVIGRRGQMIGLLVVVLAFGLAAMCIAWGSPAAGASIITTTVVVLGAALVTGKLMPQPAHGSGQKSERDSVPPPSSASDPGQTSSGA